MGKRADGGASLVEYALLVALVAGLSIGAVDEVGNRTEQRYQTTAADLTTTSTAGGSGPSTTSTTTSSTVPTTTSTTVSGPTTTTTVAATTTTTGAATTTTTVATTTTTTLPATISGACTAARCSLSISNRPADATVAWAVVGTPDATPTSGSGPSFGFTGVKKGSYVVTAILSPGGTLTRKVTCSNDNSPTCSVTA